jgi:N-acetylglutamate synthase-like GNAT family acetyltransferase
VTLKPFVRNARPDDATAIGEALQAYLVQTEKEKIERGTGGCLSPTGELPVKYRAEVEDPAGALSNCLVFVAELDRSVVGVVVVKPQAESVEIKRLWASPGVRGRGVGSTLLDVAIVAAGSVPVTLTVWDWRQSVIHMYESHGFAQVTSWDERPRLICMRRDVPQAASRSTQARRRASHRVTITH